MSPERRLPSRMVRSISYSRPERPGERLRCLADFAEAEGLDIFDGYGQGEVFRRLESELTGLFNREAAVFMPTGRLCQLVALKIHTEQRRVARVAVHPISHLEVYEKRAYELAGGIAGIPLGQHHRLPTLADVEAISDPVAAVVLEIPMLELACSLPSWEELVAISAYCRKHGIALHADGARLWEAAAFYGRSLAEIATLFDTLYVSFYKGLNAMAGGALLGDAAFIQGARVWQDRFGGILPHFFPIALDAYRCLRSNLAAVPFYHDRAQRLAQALSLVEGLRIVPDPPHTNTFWIMMPGREDRLRDAARQVVAEFGVETVHFVRQPSVPGTVAIQIVVGSATLDVPDDEAVRAFARLRDLTAG